MSYRLEGLGEAAPIAPSELGEIRSKDGYVYRVTPEDVLWMGRTAQFEGGTDPAATIWTYAQRQVLYRRTGSLKSLIEAHSQPLNPLWATPGEAKCADYPERCTPTQIERRRLARTTPWSGLRSNIRDLVMRWARAELSNPVPQAVDFADQPVTESFLRRNPDAKIVKRAGNWYISYGPSIRGGSQGWAADFVTMHFGGRSVGPSASAALRAAMDAAPFIGAGALLLAAGFAGWAYWRHRRRS